MEKNFWINSWKEGGFKTSFHRPDVHPYILQYLPPERIKGKRILLPLCGKSVDLTYFVEHADHVVGIELVETAVYQFFEEQKLTFIKKGNRFSSGQLTIINADFFHVTAQDVGSIDLVYDRASLVALPLDMRLQYVEKIHNFVPVGASQFVNTLEYAPVRPEPPFSISSEEIGSYYGATHHIKHVEQPLIPNHGLIRRWGLDYVKEHGFFLTRVK